MTLSIEINASGYFFSTTVATTASIVPPFGNLGGVQTVMSHYEVLKAARLT